jgi:arsenate reductase (glutaredoxin)
MQHSAPEIIIYHNPSCGTSRNALALIRHAGIEYLVTPPSRDTLKQLIAAMGITPRDLLREKGTPFSDLGLADPKWSHEQIIDHMLAHPILMNRPVVVSPLGTQLCRPSERVLDLLPPKKMSAFAKEDGEQVITPEGQRATGVGPFS